MSFPSDNTNVDIYLREISNWPLLKRPEEYALAKKSFRGNRKAQEQLMLHNLRLVIKIANDFRNVPGVEFLDLVNEGNMGLQKAAQKYNPDNTSGAKFSTYAAFWIKQSIRRFIGDTSRTIRMPIHMGDKLAKIRRTIRNLQLAGISDPTPQDVADELGIKTAIVSRAMRAEVQVVGLNTQVGQFGESLELQDLIPDQGVERPGARQASVEESKLIRKVLNKLDEREKFIVTRRFGIGYEPQTLEALGKKLKVTRERVRQIETMAMAKLRRILDNHRKTGKVEGSVGGHQVRVLQKQRRVVRAKAVAQDVRRQTHAARVRLLHGEDLTQGQQRLLAA